MWPYAATFLTVAFARKPETSCLPSTLPHHARCLVMGDIRTLELAAGGVQRTGRCEGVLLVAEPAPSLMPRPSPGEDGDAIA